MDNLGVFGKSFQENLCKLLLYDRAFCDQMQEVLDVGFFELKYLQLFTKKLFTYKDKYQVHPSNEALVSILRTELEEETPVLQKQVRDFFVRATTDDNIDDSDYTKSQALDFCKKQVLKDAIIKSVPLINRCSFEEIEKLITDALHLGLDNDYGYDYIKDLPQPHFYRVV